MIINRHPHGPLDISTCSNWRSKVQTHQDRYP